MLCGLPTSEPESDDIKHTHNVMTKHLSFIFWMFNFFYRILALVLLVIIQFYGAILIEAWFWMGFNHILWLPKDNHKKGWVVQGPEPDVLEE